MASASLSPASPRPAGRQKPKRRRWPWVLLVLLLVVATAASLVVIKYGTEDVKKSLGLAQAQKHDPQAPPPTGLTINDPIPIPTTVRGRDWVLTVHSVDLDATQALLDFSEHNPEPDADEVFLLVNYSLEYVGTKPEGGLPDFSIVFIEDQRKTYTTMTEFLIVPNWLNRKERILPGEKVNANLAFVVKKDQPEAGLLRVTVQLNMGNVYLALK